jgi:hypothetical protein
MQVSHKQGHTSKGAVMCLACELDALWYAEWDRPAAEGAGAAGNAAIPPAVPGEPGGTESVEVENAVETFASPSSHFRDERGGPLAQVFVAAKRAGGAPAIQGTPARPAAALSGFYCEETE